MRNFLFILTILSAQLFADDHSIAVLDFTGEGIHVSELKTLSEQFRIELLKQDSLRVMDYNDMALVLSNAGYEKPECTTMECAVIISMLLEREWMAKIHIAKIGEVYVSEGRLFDSNSGRVINVVNYDHELSMEGLISRGMHNLAEMLMSTRIPMDIHTGKNLVYIKTKPKGAMVRVGRDTLNGVTPMPLDRVVFESRPIILLKTGFEPYRLKYLPEDDSDVIFVELQHSVLQIGTLVFPNPVPEDIAIVSEDGEDRFLIDEGALEVKQLTAGKYTLESKEFIINDGDFRIRHRRTTHVSPVFHRVLDVEKDRDRYKLKRNLLIGTIILSVGTRGYLQFKSGQLYNDYSSENPESDIRHKKIEQLDQMKPIMDGISLLPVFPIIYYHAKYLKMNRRLEQR
ncbi:MAG: hypothetical protein HOA15_04605 [Candidatus Marinimicrobia bacterium]|jgi:hypothetical protein|nr:hypothetical protein [Candidatus Neomarinimicrobiota bacterium]MBT3675864.1 hypothetical protein [Candidatus Neomarinimicrobiota bacterium]MBT3763487.1 hypothetical protein [Candidatus Neomarinimicrobiota bacterium]MBT4068575.1 hypothetical protein [Candidatus Neomarinimicrobiota bacterium]MBT4271559.1 hypothetical protein [Candidatus Neomarinimicrobiota bacterium]